MVAAEIQQTSPVPPCHPVDGGRHGLEINRLIQALAVLPLRPPSVPEDTPSTAHDETTRQWRVQRDPPHTVGMQVAVRCAPRPPEGLIQCGIRRSQRFSQIQATPRVCPGVYCRKAMRGLDPKMISFLGQRQSMLRDHLGGTF